MAKRKQTNGQTTFYKTLHIKQKTEKLEHIYMLILLSRN
jgi:hypothetical protein